MSQELVTQKHYWDGQAHDFDAIYSHTKGTLGNLLDSLFRWDMYQRFHYTLRQAEPIARRTFLDVGCGTGRYSLELAKRQAKRIVGLDISDVMIAICRRRASEEGFEDRTSFIQTDLLEYRPEAKFDVCLAIGLFDYIEKPLPVLAKMRECCRDKAILSFPRLWTWRAPTRKIRLGLRKCDVYFYTIAEIDALLKAAGFPEYTCEKIGQLYCVTAVPGAANSARGLERSRDHRHLEMGGVKLRRLLSMSLPELAYRGRQEMSQRVERLGVTAGAIGQPDAIFRQIARAPSLAGINARIHAGDLGEAARMLLDQFKRAGCDRFFDGVVSEQTPGLLARQMGEARAQAVAVAEKICQRRFDLFGHPGLHLSDPVDWHLEPVSGRRAPVVHWSRLNPLDPAAVGDSKVVWELNRHQWIVRLGQAYRLTGDERYAETFAGDVRAWMRANPPGIGINWASSLEVALRLISWCWALCLFRQSRVLSPELFVEMLDGIRAHASHVEKYLSYYFAPNTHLTGEALGLFYAGIVFPELRAARRWRALGARILMEQMERQVLPDGVYFEQSTCYQRYTVEIYLHFLILAARNQVAIPAAVRERLQRMLDFLLAVRRPDGSMPSIGDADGGWLLPLASRAPDDLRGIFSTAAALFGRADCAWAAGGTAPETLWLLGAEGAKAVETLRPAPPAIAPSRLFADGGLIVMRSGWDTDANQLIFDVGPLGCPLSAGHGHADLLSIQCSVFGQPYLVDAGTYGYTAEPAWRDFFRGTAAHSTVMVDDVGQAVPAGPFKWQARPRARLHRWLSSRGVDFADASHDAYCRLPDPVVHRRRVLFVKPRYWVIVDDLEGAAEHVVALRFQFAPMEVTVDPDLWACARGAGGYGLFIRPFATVALKGEVHEGEVAPIQGWVSPDYGQRRPAPAVTYSAVTRLPLRILTLLLPTANPVGPPPAVAPLLDDSGRPMGLVLEDGRASVSFGEGDLVIVRDGE